MRWKLLRRRLSVNAPRMIVRSHLPWPLRWAAFALTLGFSAALALWAFEFGKDIAGLDRGDKEELARLRANIAELRTEYADVRRVADTAESLLKTERAAQERLTQQVRQLEIEKQSLQADLGFFERLLPGAGEGLQVRGLHAEVEAPGQLKYQLLVVQNGKNKPEFSGGYDLTLSGRLEGRPWTQRLSKGPETLKIRRVTRVEGMIDHPADAVIESVQVRVTDALGATKVTQTLKM